jgi:hypothetical protein
LRVLNTEEIVKQNSIDAAWLCCGNRGKSDLCWICMVSFLNAWGECKEWGVDVNTREMHYKVISLETTLKCVPMVFIQHRVETLLTGLTKKKKGD